MGDVALGMMPVFKAGDHRRIRCTRGVRPRCSRPRGRVGVGRRARRRGARTTSRATRTPTTGRMPGAPGSPSMPDPLEMAQLRRRVHRAPAARHRGARADAAPAGGRREASRDARQPLGRPVHARCRQRLAGRGVRRVRRAVREDAGGASTKRSTRCVSCGSRATAPSRRVLLVHDCEIEARPAHAGGPPIVIGGSTPSRRSAPDASATASFPTSSAPTTSRELLETIATQTARRARPRSRCASRSRCGRVAGSPARRSIPSSFVDFVEAGANRLMMSAQESGATDIDGSSATSVRRVQDELISEALDRLQATLGVTAMNGRSVT